MKPVLQLALDFVDLKRALKNAQAGIAGTPFGNFASFSLTKPLWQI
jgi:hypothetical protein